MTHKCKQGFRRIKGKCVRRSSSKSKGFFSLPRRNPFKLWQSYLGLFVALFVPVNLFFGFREYAPLSRLFNFSFLSAIFTDILFFVFFLAGIMMFASGFFFGASFKRGKDRFFKFGVASLVISILTFIILSKSIINF